MNEFKQGDGAVFKLTGELLMILEIIEDEKMPGYTVRRSRDYGIMSVAPFEIMPIPQQMAQKMAPQTTSMSPPVVESPTKTHDCGDECKCENSK